MEKQPLLHDESDKTKTKPSESCTIFQCTCTRIVKLIELFLLILQITSVILDWPSSCNKNLHIWMIVSLSYRLGSFIFQWLCIEPCLHWLRRDRSNKGGNIKEDDNACCLNLMFCWIIPWLWIIDNDIFLLIWTIIGTVLIVNQYHFNPLSACKYIADYSYMFYYTMLTVLAMSYIYWITSFFLSISLFCCPQLTNNCCLKMGYAIARPKGICT